MTETTDIRETVRQKYSSVAEGGGGCCGSGCGCGATDVLDQIGYTPEQAAAVPEGANLGLGCGNPIAHADLSPGETVLDLGSGAGIDCFLAGREVGAAGRVIGVDMTAAMIARARENAARSAVSNVEFRLGEIEHLPVADASVDAIISNCVVNLSPDKPQVFREAMRVLKPGGRMLISDLVLLRPLSPELQKNVDLYVGCVAGASLKEDYLSLMRDAGFDDVEVVSESRYTVGQDGLAEGSPEREAFDSVVSVKVRARGCASSRSVISGSAIDSCRPGRRLGRRGGGAETGRPLLDKGAQALGGVGRGPARFLGAGLGLETFLQRAVSRRAKVVLRESHTGGRGGGEARGERRDFRGERGLGDHAVDEADAERLGGVDHVAEPAQLEGLRQPDQAGKEPRSAPVGMESDAREGLAEARLLGRHAQVAGERQVQSGAGGGAVHRGERRERQRRQRTDDFAAGRDQRGERLVTGAPLLEARHVPHVAAGRERAPRPGHHQHADVAARGDARDRPGELLAHVVGECVELLQPVERDGGDVFLDVQQNERGHGLRMGFEVGSTGREGRRGRGHSGGAPAGIART